LCYVNQPFFNSTKALIFPLQTGHKLFLDIFSYFPQSLHTQRCPHGIIIVFESSERQIVHSFVASASFFYPFISSAFPVASIDSGDESPNILLISNGNPFI
jgi:hypothetical protein